MESQSLLELIGQEFLQDLQAVLLYYRNRECYQEYIKKALNLFRYSADSFVTKFISYFSVRNSEFKGLLQIFENSAINFFLPSASKDNDYDSYSFNSEWVCKLSENMRSCLVNSAESKNSDSGTSEDQKKEPLLVGYIKNRLNADLIYLFLKNRLSFLDILELLSIFGPFEDSLLNIFSEALGKIKNTKSITDSYQIKYLDYTLGRCSFESFIESVPHNVNVFSLANLVEKCGRVKDLKSISIALLKERCNKIIEWPKKEIIFLLEKMESTTDEATIQRVEPYLQRLNEIIGRHTLKIVDLKNGGKNLKFERHEPGNWHQGGGFSRERDEEDYDFDDGSGRCPRCGSRNAVGMAMPGVFECDDCDTKGYTDMRTWNRLRRNLF